MMVQWLEDTDEGKRIKITQKSRSQERACATTDYIYGTALRWPTLC